MKRCHYLMMCLVFVWPLSIPSRAQAQIDPCSIEIILPSFQAAALSGALDAWVQQYAESECSATTQRAVNLLVQAANLFSTDGDEARNVPLSLATSVSTFDADAEGWTTSGDASPARWRSDEGNPGGTICASDTGQGVWWYYDAPRAFVNSLSSAYGLVLRFQIKQAQTDSQGELEDQFEDVFLIGGGQTLLLNTNYNPQRSWTSYSVPLTELGGWVTMTGVPPTREQFMNVLENATVLRIRGEFRAGDDNSCLDNVELSAG